MVAEKLHDEIDMLEGHLETAQREVKAAVLDNLHEALKEAGNIPDALRLLAAKAEGKLADITTQVVQDLGAARRKL